MKNSTHFASIYFILSILILKVDKLNDSSSGTPIAMALMGLSALLFLGGAYSSGDEANS